MLERYFKALVAVLTLAGALGAASAATTTRRVSSPSISMLAPRTAEMPPRRRPRKDDGCVEAPAPALASTLVHAPAVASCSDGPPAVP